MTKSGSGNSGGASRKRRARFNRWRRGRPFAGGALLILASLVIAWIPIHIAPETILLGKALSPIGLLFAALVFLCGMFALTRPGLADIFGVFGIVFSIFSLYGALGGFGVGTVLGIFGGVLCYAWIDEDEEDSGGSGGNDDDEEHEESAFTFDRDSSEDSDGLFGSRSVRSRSPSESRGAGGRTAALSLLLVTVVVLGAFAHPFIAAVAADEFPAQSGIDGTIVVAQQFSGTRYSHQNVTTDTSNRESVPAAQLSFESASMQGVTIYKNFRTGPQTPFYIKITGSSASASKGLVLTVSEFYATEMSLAGVVPLARYKWTTCPGKDFLLRYGDLGPLPGPSIEARGVTTNTHRMYAPTITIQNLTLRAAKGTQSTSVVGTPQCITNPIGTVLELFEASALEALAAEGVLPETVLTNATLSMLTAPEEVRQGETFDVSTTLTNTGYVNDTKTVEYRFDGSVKRVKNVTLEPNESTTVTFADIETENVSEGPYEHGIFVENGSAMGTITVTESANAMNATTATVLAANETTTPATNETATNETAPAANETAPAANDTGGNETAITNKSTETVNETTSASTEESTPTPSETRTDSGNGTETTTATPIETTQNTNTSVSAESNETGAVTANETQTPANETQTQTATDSTATNTTATNPTSEPSLVSPMNAADVRTTEPASARRTV